MTRCLLIARAVSRGVGPCVKSSLAVAVKRQRPFATTAARPAEAAPASSATTGDNANGTKGSGGGGGAPSDSTPYLRYGIMGGLAATILGGAKYLHDHVGGTEGLARTASFYSIAIPKYFEYRMHMILNSPDEVWDDLHRVTSQQGLEKMLELRGFYIKSGQMCAANIGNAFPVIWQDTMSVLQDNCPAKDFKVVKSIIESEYGRPLEEVFASFDERPIGAASIGQVHRAVLRESVLAGGGGGAPGRHVVVKVMYPEVERLFRGDVRTIKMFAQVAQPVHVPPLEEIERQFMTEFDYEKESRQLAKVRENLIAAGLAGGSSKLCAVPEPYLDLCTKRVLVMEELKGDKLANCLKRDMERHAARAGKSPDQFKAEQEAEVRALKAKGVVKRGPTAKEYDQYIRLLDTERRASNLGAMTYNYSIGWVPGMQWRELVDRSSLPINHAKIVDDLIYIHGHEVLVDGYFNGDPHPGNILLIDRKRQEPQLGLIDYGQVKALPKEDRLLMCKIIIALADEDRDEVVRLMKEAGYKSQKMQKDIIYLYAKVSYDEDNDELTGGKHIQLFMEDLQSKDPIEELPKNFIMVGRTSVMLRGLAHALHQSRSVAKAWRPIAEDVLRREGIL